MRYIHVFFSALILVFSLALAPSASAQKAPEVDVQRISVETFGTLPTLSGPSLSPDGTRLVAKVIVQEELFLAVAPLSHPDEQVSLLKLPDDVEVYGWTWVNNDWLVLRIIMEETRDLERIKLHRLLGVSRDGKQVNRMGWTRLGRSGADLLYIPKDGSSKVIFAGQTGFRRAMEIYPTVFEGDVATGDIKAIVQPYEQIWNWYADREGNVRLGIGYDWQNDTQRLVYREPGKSGFRTIAKARDDDTLVVPQFFYPDSDEAVVFSDHEGFNAAYKVSLPDLDIQEKLYGVDNYDLESFWYNANGTDVAGYGYTDTKSRVKWVDPKLAKIQTTLDASLGYGNARIVSLNNDYSRLIIRAGGPSEAGIYYLYVPATQQITRIGYVNNRLKDKELAPVKTINYTASDGLELSAILTLPKQGEAKNIAAVVLPHGGPYARDEESWDYWAQMLANRGYAVIQPNYRGSAGFGTEFADLAEGEWGLRMQDDLNDARKWLVDKGIADPNRICIVGGSYGGYAAMRAAQRDGSLYQCAVSFAGVSDLVRMEDYDRQFLYGNRWNRTLRERAPDFKDISPLRHASEFSIPVLLVHGKKDLRVPVSQSQEMAERLNKAGKQVKYIEQPKGDHHLSRQEDRVQFLELMEKFLATYNPA